MINKIDAFDSSRKISFGNKFPIKESACYASISARGSAMQQVNQLKGVCKEILLRVANDKSLIAKTAAALGTVKLTESAITFFASGDEGVRLSMPRGPQGELFKMQLLKDNKPENSIVVDSFGKLVESYGRESIEYMTEDKADMNSVVATVAGVHNSVDESLFQVRMFMRKAGNSSHIIVNKIDNIKMPEISEILKKQEIERAKNKSKEAFMPTADVIKSLPKKGVEQGFSYRALIEQNKEKESVKKRKVAKPKKIITESTAEVMEAKPVPKKRGRKPKLVTTTPSVENAEKVKRVKSEKIAGSVSPEMQVKVIKVLELYEYITNELDKVGRMAAADARQAYNVTRSHDKRFVFEDVNVVAKSSKNYDNQRLLSIIDMKSGNDIMLLDSGKVLGNKPEIGKIQSSAYFKYFSQEKIDEAVRTKDFDTILDKTIARLEDFKLYVDRKGWRKLDNQIREIAQVDKADIECLERIKNEFIPIKSKFKKWGGAKPSKLKREFGIMPSHSSKLEFINPFGDGDNYAFNYVTKMVEVFFVLERIKDGEVKEKFEIAPDGKIIKNADMLLGLKTKVKYYSEEEFNRLGVSKKIKQIINVLEKKMKEFGSFVEQESLPKKKGPKPAVKEANQAVQINVADETVNSDKMGFVSIESVKSFLDKTVADIQTSADKLRAITGFKSMLDSVAEDLRSKFEEFIQKNKG